MSQKVLVLDLTHGGEVLAKTYLDSGAEVSVVDVYHTMPAEVKANLTGLGIRVLDVSPAEDFDLGVAPIHCPERLLGAARCKEVKTHHQAVGEHTNFPYPVVELTGARGKTSTCHVLAHIAQAGGKRVLLHTSRGMSVLEGGRREVLKPKVSIAPASVLAVSKEEIPTDLGIFEVSLGGTGSGTVSVITTIGDDYPIAAGTRRAFDGKVQMLKLARGAVVFPEEERPLWEAHVPKGTRTITFGKGGDVEVVMPERLRLGQSFQMKVRGNEGTYTVKIPGTYLAVSYATAFSAALSTALALGIPLKDATAALGSFPGVPGRGELTKENEKIVVRERNPGVSASSVEWNLRILQDVYGQEDIGLVLDPINQKVCEKLDLRAVEGIVSKIPAVKGAYITNTPGLERNPYFRRVESLLEVWKNHKVILYCTKEGYL